MTSEHHGGSTFSRSLPSRGKSKLSRSSIALRLTEMSSSPSQLLSIPVELVIRILEPLDYQSLLCVSEVRGLA